MTTKNSDEHVARNPTVVGVATASFFADVGHEMATAVLPSFLGSLAAPAVALGVIEGVADAAQSAAKLGGGVVADRPGVDRRAVAAGGYLVTGLGYGSFGLAGAWPFVAVGRAVSWAARGFRSPARDAVLAGAVPASHLGRAFGLERAGDSLGAIVGPLIAAGLIGVVGFRKVFFISMIPAVLAALAILTLARDTHRSAPAVRKSVSGARRLARENSAYRRLLSGVGLYGLGNFSSTLLILRATDLLHAAGRSGTAAASVAVLLYTLHNASNAVAAYPAGVIADRVPRRAVLMFGIVLFGGSCVAFAFGSANLLVLAILFVAVGASKAAVETGQGSYASEILPAHARGRGFGLLGLVDGIGDLIASVAVGALWTATAPAWGFAYAATLSFVGAAVLASPNREAGPD